MATKLTVRCTMTQNVEVESYSQKDLSKAPLSEVFQEFGMIYDRSMYYLNKYINCYVLTEKQGYLSYKIEFI